MAASRRRLRRTRLRQSIESELRVQRLRRWLHFERLEARRLFSIDSSLGPFATADMFSFDRLPANIDSHLAELYQINYQNGQDSSAVPPLTVKPEAISEVQANGLIQFAQSGQPMMSVWTRANVADVAAELTTLGATIHATSDQYHLIEASFDIADLEAVASLPGVLSITPVYRPIMYAGSVQTQGDAVLNANVVRAAGFDGSPFLIGA